MIDHLLTTRSGRKLEVREYGDPAGDALIFFHGLIGSHHQAAYIAEQARQAGLRIIAPNRPGVGASEFVVRKTPLEAVNDVEDIAAELGLDEFSVIGISGGTCYTLATLFRLAPRIRTTTVISGMGPARLRGALQGMDRRRRMMLALGSRFRALSLREFRKMEVQFEADANRFLNRLIATWSAADRRIFERQDIYDLFMKDLHQVFTPGQGPETLAQELAFYDHFGFDLRDLPSDKHVTLWQALDDTIVPPRDGLEAVPGLAQLRGSLCSRRPLRGDRNCRADRRQAQAIARRAGRPASGEVALSGRHESQDWIGTPVRQSLKRGPCS